MSGEKYKMRVGMWNVEILTNRSGILVEILKKKR